MLPQLQNHQISVDEVTGGLLVHATDLVIPALGVPLVFERYHDSLRDLDLQHGCAFPFNERLVFDPDASVRHILPDSSEFRFVASGGGYSASAGTNHQTLVHGSDGTWTITFKSQRRHVFDANGRLTKVIDTFGNTLKYGWTATGDISTITDTSNRVITMTRNESDPNNKTWTFQDWTGRSWVYTWTNGMALKSFRDPMGNVTTYEVPETSGDPNSFSGISKITLPDGTVWVSVAPAGISPLSTKVGTLTYANGLVVSYSYDATNRKTTVTAGSRVHKYEYSTSLMSRSTRTRSTTSGPTSTAATTRRRSPIRASASRSSPTTARAIASRPAISSTIPAPSPSTPPSTRSPRSRNRRPSATPQSSRTTRPRAPC